MSIRWLLHRCWLFGLSVLTTRRFRQHLRRARPGDIALDCGAHVGDVTAEMAEEGLRVIAFEPDDACFAELTRRFANEPRVTVVQKAVGGRNRRAPFFRTPRNGEMHSDASSLVRMPHHRQDPAGEVEVVSIVDVIESLDSPVHLLKLDIEGAEAEVLEALLDAGLCDRIGRTYVETHEWLDDTLAGPMLAIRERIKAQGIVNINLRWR